MFKSLLQTNKHLRDPVKRKKDLAQAVISSSAIEGIDARDAMANHRRVGEHYQWMQLECRLNEVRRALANMSVIPKSSVKYASRPFRSLKDAD